MLRALLCLLLWYAGSGWAQTTQYPFRISSEALQNGHLVVARNEGPAPVSVHITLEGGELVQLDRTMPVDVVVPPRSVTPVLRTQGRPGQAYSFRLNSRWSVGDFTRNPPTDTAYRLPFKDGLSFRISQAGSGPITTHTTPDSRYAVDFPMPEGTPIVAIADGMVVRTEEEQMEGGQRPDLLTKANSIRILHADGSMSLYGHLSYKGVLVGIGQQVRAGQIIGLSGSTGFSSGPHLHLSVLRLVKSDNGFSHESIPFRFYVGNPPVIFTPTYGMLANADYRNPGQVPPIVARAPNTVVVPVPSLPVTNGGPTASPYLPSGVNPR